MSRTSIRSLAALALLPALILLPTLASAKKTVKKAAAKSAAVVAAPVALKSASATVQVKGDSTLHGWTVNATAPTLAGEATLKGAGSLLEQVKGGALGKLELALKVDGLKSTEGSGMDKNMHSALESDKFTDISFSLKSYTVKDDLVTAKGSLSIHGQPKDVELTGKLAAKGEGISVNGSYDLNMSEYGVKPPVMMLGTVKVKDKVTIAYEFDLAK